MGNGITHHRLHQPIHQPCAGGISVEARGVRRVAAGEEQFERILRPAQGSKQTGGTAGQEAELWSRTGALLEPLDLRREIDGCGALEYTPLLALTGKDPRVAEDAKQAGEQALVAGDDPHLAGDLHTGPRCSGDEAEAGGGKGVQHRGEAEDFEIDEELLHLHALVSADEGMPVGTPGGGRSPG